ncbi:MULTISPECIES: TIGR03089 family protein [Micromonospora]|uniref:TIGR03089 family protein n=1 Tax=Micromonospora solifontis TaxID=2487138 RepID=A0ABX9WKY0_9ACTN|nr:MULTISPECIES: TIGR03089 family protein [Micromonospora]NES15222.1 TIGR03089 family protein [Micromonospora sp. PPF5-17B]NES36494.1 TIGR03089 family protein [Micromonospora solifontis]NES56362.1 TIGR03089 family protein [Micromonospora sp. PPF5-6]RNL99386.1 TIGR03089 family protein [Micromonospora solifontis]
MADNIARVFADAIATDPTRPLLTWYDDATGERTELSGATCANWVAKTANLLVDEVALAPGDTAGVLLPPHWQTAAVLLGCWSAKLTVVDAPGDVDVIFAAASKVGEADRWSAGERYVLALDPFALPMREVPAGFTDFVPAVRGHGDHFTAYPAGGEADAALLARAEARAAELCLTPGDRILVDTTTYPDRVDWLLAPLAAGATIVACANLDPSRLDSRTAAEKVTRTLA